MQPAGDQVFDAIDLFPFPGRCERARANQVPALALGEFALGCDVDAAGLVRMTWLKPSPKAEASRFFGRLSHVTNAVSLPPPQVVEDSAKVGS